MPDRQAHRQRDVATSSTGTCSRFRGCLGELCVGGVAASARVTGGGRNYRGSFVLTRIGRRAGASPREALSQRRPRALPSRRHDRMSRPLDRQVKLRGFASRARRRSRPCCAAARGAVSDAAVMVREDMSARSGRVRRALDRWKCRLAGLQEETASGVAGVHAAVGHGSRWRGCRSRRVASSDRDVVAGEPAREPSRRAPAYGREPDDDLEARTRWMSGVRSCWVARGPARTTTSSISAASRWLAMRLLARAARPPPFASAELARPLRTPTVAGLAERVRAALAWHGRRTEPGLVALSPRGALPLSWRQERLWFLDQLDPLSPAYNLAWTIASTGRWTSPVCSSALDRIVARHESLRKSFSACRGARRCKSSCAVLTRADRGRGGRCELRESRTAMRSRAGPSISCSVRCRALTCCRLDDYITMSS